MLYSSSCHQTFTLCAYNGRWGGNLLTSRPLSAVEQSPANPVEIAEGPSFSLEPSRKYPGALIVVEGNPALAARLERVLFDDHFEVLHVNGDAVPVSVLESQYAAFASAGLVVIYSCDTLTPEGKRKFATLAADRYFDLSALQLPEEEIAAARRVLALLQSHRVVADDGNPSNFV